jgi:hypothetical protein
MSYLELKLRLGFAPRKIVGLSKAMQLLSG